MISGALISWYNTNKRDLPWRSTRDPYRIWLSEVILQQTRVAQGLPYYEKFTEAFPTVFDLARAPEQKVLKLWQGLGYYSRARNLHRAAKDVVKLHGGRFPGTYEGLLELKGVGDYTASAIASFCFNKPHAVLDGNVFRVLARLFAIDTPINSGEGKKQFALLANELLDRKDPGTYNQAIMEFGAQHCTPQNPRCDGCPLFAACASGPKGAAGQYPKKNASRPVRNRYFEYFFVRQGSTTYIAQRGAGDIWAGLYELPALEFAATASRDKVLGQFAKQVLGNERAAFRVKCVSGVKTHQLSHQKIMARFWQVELKASRKVGGYKAVALRNLSQYPFPVLIGRHLQEITIFE
jgi:A/G-specific adenine glycosylase